MIIDDRGRHVEGELGVGPFREGDSLALECNVPGGRKEGARKSERLTLQGDTAGFRTANSCLYPVGPF